MGRRFERLRALLADALLGWDQLAMSRAPARLRQRDHKSAPAVRKPAAQVEGSGTPETPEKARAKGVFKPELAKTEPTPPGVNSSIVLLPWFAA